MAQCSYPALNLEPERQILADITTVNHGSEAGKAAAGSRSESVARGAFADFAERAGVFLPRRVLSERYTLGHFE